MVPSLNTKADDKRKFTVDVGIIRVVFSSIQLTKWEHIWQDSSSYASDNVVVMLGVY